MSITTYAEDMKTVYVRINWQNQPSTTTALGATNLNKIDLALSIVDGRVVTLNTTKLDQATANTMVQDIDLDANGVFTIKKLDGTTKTYDTKLEKLAVNFEYDSTTQRLVITLDDGTKQYVDMSALITEFEFLDSPTIAFTKNSAGKMSADVKNGSITEAKMQPNYLADIKVQAQNASNSATSALQYKNQAQSLAIGGVTAGDTTNNAKYFMEQARIARDEAEDISNVGVAGKDKLGLVNGNGNVEVRTTGDMWADPYKDKATALTGTFITCPTAGNGLLHVKEMSGETVQKVTVQGKNKFDEKLVQGTFATAVIGSQPVETASTTRVRSVNYTQVLPSSTYTFNTTNTVSKIVNISIKECDGNNLLIAESGWKTVPYTFTTSSTTKKLRIVIKFSDDSIITVDLLKNPQIELGSATAYEVFTPNSPSPEYPSALEYAKEFDVISFNLNRLNVNDIHYSVFKNGGTQDGVMIIVNSNGSRSLTGTTTKDNVTWHGVDMIKYLEKGKRYKHLQGEIIGNIRCSFKINRTTGTTYESNFTYDNTVLEVLPYYQVSTSGTSLNITIYPMVVEYGYTGDYIQYKGDKKSISFPFMSVPLAKNRKEYVNDIFSDVVVAKEVVFNGTETFFGDATNTSGKVRWKLPITDGIVSTTTGIGNVKCSHFKNILINETWYCTANGISVNTVNNAIYIFEEDFASWTNAQFKAWVKEQFDKGTPLKVHYQLATQIITPTDEIYLKTNKGTTNFFSNSYPQVSMTVDFKSELWSRDYLQDTNDVRLDNKLNEINGYFSKYTTSPLIVLSQVELDNAINNVSSVDRQWYRLAVHVNVENLTLHGGVWYIEGFRHSSGYEWQNASTYYVGGSAKRTRAKMDNTWSAWSNILTSLDLVQSDTVSDATKPVSSVVTEALGKEIDTLNNNLVKYKYIAGMAVNSIANQHALVYDVASDVELAGKNVLGVIPSIVAGWANGEYIFSLYYNIETKKVMLTASITQTYTVSFTVLYV